MSRHFQTSFKLLDARNSKWKDIRLSFSDWDWLKATYGSDGIEGYYFNGPGVEGLVKAARMDAGLDPEAEGIDYNSEGGTCYIHFSAPCIDEIIFVAITTLRSSRQRL